MTQEVTIGKSGFFNSTTRPYAPNSFIKPAETTEQVINKEKVKALASECLSIVDKLSQGGSADKVPPSCWFSSDERVGLRVYDTLDKWGYANYAELVAEELILSLKNKGYAHVKGPERKYQHKRGYFNGHDEVINGRTFRMDYFRNNPAYITYYLELEIKDKRWSLPTLLKKEKTIYKPIHSIRANGEKRFNLDVFFGD